jgi:hypothetical protein
MTSETALQNTQLTPGRVATVLRDHGWTWKSCGACVGLLGGVFAPLLGLALTALAWFITQWHGVPLKNAGAILLFLTIPLLILGAHCLDLIDQENEHARGRDPERQESCVEEGEVK